MNNQDFFFGKRVLVTGGDGFIAANLIKTLIDKGAVVVATTRHERPVQTIQMLCSPEEADKYWPDIENCDLLDLTALRKICDRHKIDTIFHTAASAIVSEAAQSPAFTIENNVMGTLNILEVARINKIPRVIVASSDKSYGDHFDDAVESLPYNEGQTLRGLDVYSASKVCVDTLARTYTQQFNVPVLVARFCNIFGPGDLNFSRLIPRTIMCLLSQKTPMINQGNEKILREYVYIDDVIEAYLLLIEQLENYYGPNNCNMPRSGKDVYGWGMFNIGTHTKEEIKSGMKCDKIRSVSEVMDLLRAKINDIPPVVKEKPASFIELPDQYLDSSKIRTLGFNPKVNFDHGLDRTIEWYKQHYEYLLKLATHYL